jgi:hypothetical protein
LRRVGSVFAFAVQEATDFGAEMRVIRRERQQTDRAPGGSQPITKHLGLSLLAALIESFEDDEEPAHGARHA